MSVSPLRTYLGEPSVFEVLSDDPATDALSARERRLFVGALNAHTLTTPGADLTVHLYAPHDGYTPRTTDDRTFDGRSRLYRHRRATVRVRSTVTATPSDLVDARQVALLRSTTRHVMLSSDATAAARPEFLAPGDLRGKVLRRMRVTAPLLYDEVRDLELRRHGRPLRARIKRMHDESLFVKGSAFEHARMNPAAAAPDGAPRAALIGMHWFEMGGAERWAFETVRIVRDAGLLPVVLTSRDSHHELITRPELDGALLLPLSEATSLTQTPGSEQLLRALLENVDLRGVVVHHSQWLYDRLPFLKRRRPDVPVIDTTHIVEYRGGGFPATSAHADPYVDVHHVISPALATWMTQVQGVPAQKVEMAPLGGLTVDLEKDAAFRPRTGERPFTVAFVGRLARQKAPEVFIEAAARVHRQRPDVRFVLHGHGELGGWVDDLVAAADLGDVLERRDDSVPVGTTLEDADLLAVTSHNEGLTLTTLEAVAHGTPVVSTDVGAQSNLVPAEALVPRNVHRAVRGIADLVLRYADDEEARRRLWESERAAERELVAIPSAGVWFEELVSTW